MGPPALLFAGIFKLLLEPPPPPTVPEDDGPSGKGPDPPSMDDPLLIRGSVGLVAPPKLPSLEKGGGGPGSGRSINGRL